MIETVPDRQNILGSRRPLQLHQQELFKTRLVATPSSVAGNTTYSHNMSVEGNK